MHALSMMEARFGPADPALAPVLNVLAECYAAKNQIAEAQRVQPLAASDWAAGGGASTESHFTISVRFASYRPATGKARLRWYRTSDRGEDPRTRSAHLIPPWSSRKPRSGASRGASIMRRQRSGWNDLANKSATQEVSDAGTILRVGQAKPPVPPSAATEVPWWGRRFRLPMPGVPLQSSRCCGTSLPRSTESEMPPPPNSARTSSNRARRLRPIRW